MMKSTKKLKYSEATHVMDSIFKNMGLGIIAELVCVPLNRSDAHQFALLTYQPSSVGL